MQQGIAKSCLAIALCLSACVSRPKPTNANQPPSPAPPESQQQDYLRIIGSWRWDRLDTPARWVKLLPGCLATQPQAADAPTAIVLQARNTTNWRDLYDTPVVSAACKARIGGVSFYVNKLTFIKASTHNSKTSLLQIMLYVPNTYELSEFGNLIKAKYPVDRPVEVPCSRYSCIYVGDYFRGGKSSNQHWVLISPSAQTSRIMASVNLVPGQF